MRAGSFNVMEWVNETIIIYNSNQMLLAVFLDI